jgi:uncharacterized protein (TIGR00661 family)
MRILYGIQGTGHGHISRAKVLLPKLKELADVDVLLSGYNYKLDIGEPVKYKVRGISLTYDSNGSVDYFGTAKQLKPATILSEINQVPVREYDFIVNDFEPVTAWAAQQAGVPCVAISHQAAFLSSAVPRPEKKSVFAEAVLKHFAPSTHQVACHYKRYDHFIEPPIVRQKIKDLNPSHGDHCTVYLPAFDHETLCSIFGKIRETQWHIFSPYCDSAYSKSNVSVHPISKEKFLNSLEQCSGVISSSGFELTSEAMFLGKKLLTIPIRNQYEQLSNAAALSEMGGVVCTVADQNFISIVRNWLTNAPELTLAEVSDEDVLAHKIIEAGMKLHEPVINTFP